MAARSSAISESFRSSLGTLRSHRPNAICFYASCWRLDNQLPVTAGVHPQRCPPGTDTAAPGQYLLESAVDATSAGFDATKLQAVFPTAADSNSSNHT